MATLPDNDVTITPQAGHTFMQLLTAVLDQYDYWTSLNDQEKRAYIARLLSDVDVRGGGAVITGIQFRRAALHLLPELSASTILGRLNLNRMHPNARAVELKNSYATKFRGRYRSTTMLAGQNIDFVGDLNHLYQTNSQRRLVFSALGCQGTNTDFKKWALGAQKKTAESMKTWHLGQRLNGNPVTFNFLLGDNFYEDGLPPSAKDGTWATGDKMYKSAYLEMYRELGLKGGMFSRARHLDQKLENYVCLGNHDYGYHGHSIQPSGNHLSDINSFESAMRQVEYTYLARPNGAGWNMPFRYYALTSDVANFFVIDTQTFLFDEAQQRWLREAYQALSAGNAKWNLLMGHHGFLTYGKRQLTAKKRRGLANMFRTQAAVNAADDIEQERESEGMPAGVTGSDIYAAGATSLTENICSLIFNTVVFDLGLDFDFNVVAHDHFMGSGMLHYQRGGANHSTYYILSGGGGAGAKPMKIFGKTLGDYNIVSLETAGPKHSLDMILNTNGFATFDLKAREGKVELRNSKNEVYHTINLIRGPNGPTDNIRSIRSTFAGFREPQDLFSKLGGGFYKTGGRANEQYKLKQVEGRFFSIDWGADRISYRKPDSTSEAGHCSLRGVESVIVDRTNRVVKKLGEDCHMLLLKHTGKSRWWHFMLQPNRFEDFVKWVTHSLSRFSPDCDIEEVETDPLADAMELLFGEE
ncbi:MAG: metallophosphoesterase [Myxococcota bacterium]|nr:metallophosphoesterase [Myxococcota bacterium]